jgi:hypothetical protein
MCREELGEFDLATMQTNAELETIVKAKVGDAEYNGTCDAQQKEFDQELTKSRATREMPFFCLGNGEPLPVGSTMSLHLFEPRYRVMCREFAALAVQEFCFAHVSSALLLRQQPAQFKRYKFAVARIVQVRARL